MRQSEPHPGWAYHRLKFVARLKYGDSLAADARVPGHTQVFGSNGAVGSHDTPNTKGPVIIIGRKGSYGALQYSDKPVFAIDTTFYIDRSSSNVHLKWLFYALKTLGLSGSSQDTGVPGLSREFAENQSMPVPPAPEQQTIARFLDHRTAQLDALIEKKRQLLDKLAEKRSALITRAVTRGLDPDAPMKDSGVPWLGEIPAHWKSKRLKHAVMKVIDTEHKTAPSEPKGNYLVVRTQNIRNGKLLLDDLKFTDEKSFIEWTRRGLPERGDILFTREAPAGEACMVPSRTQLCIGQRVVLLKADRVRWDSEYLMSSLYAGLADEFIQKISVGSTVVHFNMRDIGSIPVLMPPKTEQEKISKRIRSIRSDFGSSESTLNKTIEKLTEYRSALITAAVTGQIDVRDWQPPETSRL